MYLSDFTLYAEAHRSPSLEAVSMLRLCQGQDVFSVSVLQLSQQILQAR